MYTLLAAQIACSSPLQSHQGLEYVLIEPHGKAPYRAILALPPGDQSYEMVQAVLTPWQDSWREQGLLVVSPVLQGSSALRTPKSQAQLVSLLSHLNKTYDLQGDRFEVVGVSNGGRASFELAAVAPQLLHSLVVLPGAAPSDLKLSSLVNLPITLVVGGLDDQWLSEARRINNALPHSKLIIRANEGHMAFKSVQPAELDGWLKNRAGANKPPQPPEEAPK